MPPARRRTPPPTVEPIEEAGPGRELRTGQLGKLQKNIENVHVMVGGAISVIPPQMAGEKARLLGTSIRHHSTDIADAWIELCEEDKRVRQAWEALTSYSSWGRVVGEYLTAFGDATPAILGRRAEQAPVAGAQPQSDDLAAAMALADYLARSAAQERQQPAESQETNGTPAPPPTEQQVRNARAERQRMEQRPQRQQQQQPVQPVQQQEAPQVSQRRPVGMPSPADLGVVNPDVSEEFPSSGAENVRG